MIMRNQLSVVRHAAAITVLVVASGWGHTQGAEPPRVNPNAAAVKAFGDRTHAYMDLRAHIVKSVPALPARASPGEIARHQTALAAALRSARRGAREGEFFTPDIAPQFRRIIRNDFKSRDVVDAFAAMEEVPPSIVVGVNEPWPRTAPHATVPPRLLTSLYALPEGLEYRFLGRHLVLLDTEAELVLDVVRDVVPSSVRRLR
jgi:hypothetical protein